MRRSSPALALLVLSACPGEDTTTAFVTAGVDTSSTGTGESPATPSGGLPTTSRGETSSGTTTDTSSGDTSTGTSTSSGDGGSSSSSGGDSSSSGGEPAPTCMDALLNQDETDVDCGGATCAPCELGGACVEDIDCASSWCDVGACKMPDCLVDSECDALDGPCVDAFCDLETRACLTITTHQGEVCEDGDLCTVGQVCDEGVCKGGGTVDCAALETFCGVGVCDSGTGACAVVSKPGMDGVACDDGFNCTPDDACMAGKCGVGGPGYLLFEDFTALATGWDLGPTWEVGPAMISKAGYNGVDPADDHSPGDDMKLAGVLIGGVIPEGPQDKTCLTSPEIDATGQATLWLSYWRHLHTEFFPFVVHTVEAFDGVDWQQVEVGYANPGIDEADWTFHEHDLAAYAGPQLRVRICYLQTGDAIPSAGWSLDDVTIGPYSCTPDPP